MTSDNSFSKHEKKLLVTGITFSCHKMVSKVPKRSINLRIYITKMEACRFFLGAMKLTKHKDKARSRLPIAHK